MRNLFLVFVILLLYACSSGKKNADEQAYLDSLEALDAKQPVISEDVIADIIQQIPSPLEISFLLKNSGANYDYSMLNSPDNISNYNSNYQKALNLGVYGTDLGYANIYEQNQDAIFYLSSIRSLADDLSIGQFFDFGTIKRLATNSSNLDSLLLITTQNFNYINVYLQENNRSNLSILLLTGGWIEALHITCQVALKNKNNKALMEKIGEQKIILDNIKLLLDFYTSDPNIASLHKKVLELEDVYSNIEIIYTYAEPTFKEVNGMLVIEDNSTTTINITWDNVVEIGNKVKEIRKKIIE